MNFPKEIENKIISDMCKMIQCATVSNQKDELVDWEEYKKFYKLLEKSFPNIYKKAQLFNVGKTGLVYKIQGKNNKEDLAEKRAFVLMAHYDVVPAYHEEWDFPPFSGDLITTSEGDFIRGRGTLDTKGTLCACMEAVEIKLKEDWLPQTDLYLCFSGEEEISGNTTVEIVDWFKKQNIKVDFVLDEGGAIVENAFPGLPSPCAMIGTAEKGFINMDLIVEGKAGHASAPPKHSAAGLAARLVCQIEKHRCKSEFTKPVKELFAVMGPNNKNCLLKFLFSNLFITKGLISFLSKIMGGELYALLHTSCAVTMLEGSKAYNVLPSQGKIGLNFRLLGSDSLQKAEERLLKLARKTLGKKVKISTKILQANNPSIVSDTKCPQWDCLCNVIKNTWPDILISPYLMMACSDSRHYCKITDKVYRFSGMFLSKEERAMIHGKNERIATSTLIKTVDFYVNLLEQLNF